MFMYVCSMDLYSIESRIRYWVDGLISWLQSDKKYISASNTCASSVRSYLVCMYVCICMNIFVFKYVCMVCI